jgi:hypothetical protein
LLILVIDTCMTDITRQPGHEAITGQLCKDCHCQDKSASTDMTYSCNGTAITGQPKTAKTRQQRQDSPVEKVQTWWTTQESEDMTAWKILLIEDNRGRTAGIG